MKIRTLIEFSEILDSEFAWRRKELTLLRSTVNSASPISKNTFLRSAVALLYAHWEGFIKEVGETYLIFVATRRLKLHELSPNFKALALRTKFLEFGQSKDPQTHILFLDFIASNAQARVTIPTNGVVNTDSNLSSELLRRIITSLGLNYVPFELKSHLIDSKLLYWRNNIAHGQYICPSESDFEILYNEITILIREFKTQIENAAVNQQYKTIVP